MSSETINQSWLIPGAIVISKSVGIKSAFVGTLIRYHAGSWPVHKSGRPWIVRCHHGLHWHRTTDELRPYGDLTLLSVDPIWFPGA